MSIEGKHVRRIGPGFELPISMWWSSIHCELLELLGEGGQGRVYKALRSEKRSGLKQTVAVKILHSRTAVKSWRREFESLARVRSPYCVQVLSFERFSGRPALVLEYVDGVSLAQLGQARWLTNEEIHEVSAQLESALRDLHRQNIFHGDLSPQNVLLDREGRVRVLDFGLANSCEDEARLTPGFAAPERLAGERASAVADIYSLGRVMRFLNPEAKGLESYLSLQPQERRLRGHASCHKLQESLGHLVRELLDRRRLMRGARTKSHLVKAKPFRTRTKETVLAAIMSLLVLATSSASQLHRPKQSTPATLVVRTRNWHYVVVDGRPAGYAPISLSLTAGEPHRLQWRAAAKNGETVIHLKPLETRVLEDSDFSH